MRVLGIDPGSSILGWSLLDNTFTLAGYGVITTESGAAIGDKIVSIHAQLERVIAEHRPDCCAVERLFFSRNTTTAIDVAKCIGAVLLTARLAGLEIAEYNPLQVKQALTGYGRATKRQMQTMVMRILGLPAPPKPDDAADAIAIALCHLITSDGIRKYDRIAHGNH